MKHQNISVTGSLNLNGVGVVTSASLNAYTASSDTKIDALIGKTGSYATTGSNTFTGSQIIQGTLTAQTLVVQTVTSSVLYTTGSNIIGSSLSNVQQLTGSVGITGSFTSNGPATVSTTSTVPLTVETTSGNSGIILKTSSSTYNWLLGAQYNVGNTFEITPSTAAGGTTFSAPALKISNTGAATFTGSITTTYTSISQPGSATTITQNARFTNSTTSTANGSGVGFDFALTDAAGSGKQTGQIASVWSDNSSNDVADLAFYTRPTGAGISEKVRITGNGYVGIGTSTPGQLLEVLGGEIKAGRVDSSNEGGQVSFGRSTDNATAWYIDVYGNTSTPILRFVDASAGAVRLTLNSGGQLTTYNGQTGGYVRSDSGYVNETQTITNNCTAYFFYKYTGSSNGSSTTYFNITGLSTTNGTWADISVRSRKDATGGAINTVSYVQINGADMIGGVFASGTGATQVSKTFRVVRMSDEWVIVGSVGTY